MTSPDDIGERRRPPARTLRGRENQLIRLATDLAEEQMTNGTASAQVITHYLKLGSTREKSEQKKLALEARLLEAKAQDLASRSNSEEIYAEALKAMRLYQGDPREEEDVDPDLH